MIRLLRLYRSDKGIWRYDIERDGKVRWSSLRTRDEYLAKLRYAQFKALFEELAKEKS